MSGEPRRVSILDATSCIFFCAIKRARLLIQILTAAGLEILVPDEVRGEVLARMSNQEQWRLLEGSKRARQPDRSKPAKLAGVDTPRHASQPMNGSSWVIAKSFVGSSLEPATQTIKNAA